MKISLRATAFSARSRNTGLDEHLPVQRFLGHMDVITYLYKPSQRKQKAIGHTWSGDSRSDLLHRSFWFDDSLWMAGIRRIFLAKNSYETVQFRIQASQNRYNYTT